MAARAFVLTQLRGNYHHQFAAVAARPLTGVTRLRDVVTYELW